MLALLQRVLEAKVVVNGKTVGEIQHGILAFIAVEPHDNESSATKLADKIINYRLFSDQDDKMNLCLGDLNKAGLLLVPQFTLAANTRKGLRPNFSTAAPPALGHHLFELMLHLCKERHPLVSSGQFGADMKVHLINNGPVTFLLEI